MTITVGNDERFHMHEQFSGSMAIMNPASIPESSNDFEDEEIQGTELDINNSEENYVEEEESQRYGLTTADEGLVKFDGLLLGEGSSKRDTHTHRPGTTPPTGKSCSGCRWTETRIFWSDSDNMWVIHTIGKTVINGETNRYKIVWARKPKDIIESLMVKSKFIKKGVRELELPKANRVALLEAAENDEEVNEAVENYGLR